MKALYKNGTDAVLIGELLMRAEDRKRSSQNCGWKPGKDVENVRRK